MINWISSRYFSSKCTKKVLLGKPRILDIYDNYEMLEAKEALRKGMKLPAITSASVAFEKQIKKFARRYGLQTKNKTLQSIIDSFKYLPKPYDDISEFDLAELQELRIIRNKIVHAEADKVDNFGKIEDIISRFSNALSFIFVQELCNPNYSRFQPLKWQDNSLHFKIDDSILILSEQDIDNLLTEFNYSYRGRVKYMSGRNVISEQAGFSPYIFTYTIDGYAPFTLNEHDRMGIEDILINCIGIYKYG